MHVEYLLRTWCHLRNGTLISAIKRKCRRYLRQKWWESQASIREHFEIELQRDVKMRLYFDSELSRLIYCRDFEVNEIKFVNNFLKPGDIFVDIGANIGLFSLIAAHRVGNSGKVYAFEPTDKPYQRLSENVRLNNFNNVIHHRVALSDQVGQFPFFEIQDGFDGWNSFARPREGRVFTQNVVQCDTWDNFASRNNVMGKVSMMKIDVEGWEARLLLGGSETLSRMDAPVLQVEFSSEMAKAAGSSCREIYHVLETLGYELFRYEAEAGTIVHELMGDNYCDFNLIASKDPKQLITRLKR